MKTTTNDTQQQPYSVQQQPPPSASEHRMADTWRDCVVVCACGWRTAARTMGVAKVEWVKHAKS